MVRDWRDDRIEELEAQVGALEAQLRARDERTAELEQQVAALMKQVAELTARLGQNSANSHLPPSTDSPEERRKRRNKNKAKKKDRKRGAQKGHAGAHRELLPEEKVSKFVDVLPAECENCWELLPNGRFSPASPAHRDPAGRALHDGVAAPRGDLPVLRFQDSRSL